VELIHLASLIHDDIIDGSDLRRDEKTAHQRWGNRVAVLLGDYALAKSMEMIWSDPDTRIPLALCRASSRLIEAESLESERAGKSDLSLDRYQEIIEGKTASLFESCGECGALLSGQDEAGVRRGAELGRGFGIAFQIVDDMLDFGLGDEGLGKRTFSDVKNGYQTLPLILFFAECSPDARLEMKMLLEGARPETQRARIRELLEEYSVFQKARGMAAGHVLSGMPYLESLADTPASRHLRRVCTLMTDRTD
jgi:geranylgeranyl pyrophosphate synthase